MAAISELQILACDGCFQGFPAWIGLFLLVVCLIGSIWMLLWSNLGARMAYLITMISLSAFMMILSAIWIFGAPGTTTATGPRGREPAWVPFLPESEFAEDFQAQIDTFPTGENWEPVGTVFPGNVDTAGEFENVRATLTTALSNRAKVQETDGTSPGDWSFRDASRPATTPAEEEYAEADVAFNQAATTKLIVGVSIPATEDTPAVTVFAYRDKGLVFLPALEFLLVSIALFILHVWLIARAEREEEARAAQMAPSPPAPEPV